jgi:DNA primase
MSDTVQQIKERLSIVDVVSPYVKLTRAGKYWKGLSPFTKEKTPSFFVTPDRGLYHCFSTGKGGDMFTFVEEMEGVDFKGALKILAEKAGVEIVREAPGAKSERDQVYAALDSAASHYTAVLEARPDVTQYLLERGIRRDAIKKWRLGYAPKEWHALRDALTASGHTRSTLEKAGLVKPGDSGMYDRFRGRIMFPLFDQSGRVIAFSGRIFEDDPVHPQAKYVNSPEGLLFDKSRALYGIHEAKSAIRDLGFSMLVEGQVDLLLAHGLGFKNAVATSGTAFTRAHAELLKRYSPNILLAYDGDQAGINATHRAALMLLPLGMNPKVVGLPAGSDPAELIRTNPQGFKDAVRAAVHVVDFFLAHLARTITDQRALKLAAARIVLPLVAAIESALDRSHFVARAAEALSVTPDVIMAELKKSAQPDTPQTAVQGGLSTLHARADLLFGILRTFEDASDPRAERVRETLTLLIGAKELDERRAGGRDQEESARIIASENFFLLYESASAQNAFLDALVQEVRATQSPVRDEYARTKQALVEAEKRGDSAEVARIMAALSRLSKEL